MTLKALDWCDARRAGNGVSETPSAGDRGYGGGAGERRKQGKFGGAPENDSEKGSVGSTKWRRWWQEEESDRRLCVIKVQLRLLSVPNLEHPTSSPIDLHLAPPRSSLLIAA